MTTLKAAMAIALLAGAATPALSQGTYQQPNQQVPAPAQPAAPAQPQPAQAAPQRDYHLSRGERTALQPALTAVNASDWPAATTALAAAVPEVRGAGAKYLVAQIRLRIGIGTNDRAQQAQAIDEMLASGFAQPSELRALYENQMEFAIAAGDTAKAQRAMAELDRIAPGDPGRYVRLAQIRANANDYAGAIGFYQQAVQAAQRANQPIQVEWRRQMARLAYESHSPDMLRYFREWLTAAPSAAGWHDTLALFAQANAGFKLDSYRLMRAAGAMTSENDFIQLAEAANGVRAFGEVQAVLQDGLTRRVITQNTGYAQERLTVASRRATDDRASLAESRRAALAGNAAAALGMGDAYYGYGQYAEAAELYRAALQKGTDANIGNLRLGAALALAGQRAPAEAAFRAVTGPGADLAQLWLLWLSTRTS
jgi:tetratricopeptide (TPR) repeat protein